MFLGASTEVQTQQQEGVQTKNKRTFWAGKKIKDMTESTVFPFWQNKIPNNTVDTTDTRPPSCTTVQHITIQDIKCRLLYRNHMLLVKYFVYLKKRSNI